MRSFHVSFRLLLKLSFMLLFLFGAQYSSAQNYELKLVFNNIDAVEGELSIGIFKNESTFLDEGNQYKKLILKVDGNSVSHTVTLPKGEYAISVYHDQNKDKECNRNFFGMPEEGYGFSNNIKPKLSAPKFRQCKFSLNGDTEHIITIQN